MPQDRLPPDAGLSLVEILVAISILALMAATVTLSMAPGSDPLRDEADRLALSFRHASQEAMVTGQPVGFALDGDGGGYQFTSYVDGRWWAINDHPTLGRHDLADRVEARLEGGWPVAQDADDVLLLPDVWFDPAAMTDPFSLRLVHEGDAVTLDWTLTGRVRIAEAG